MATKAQRPVKWTWHDPRELRRRRILAGLNQMDLAYEVQVSAAHISRLEGGKAEASPRVLLALAEVLDCTIADLERPKRTGLPKEASGIPMTAPSRARSRGRRRRT